MCGQVMADANDIEKSKRFDDAVLGVLGVPGGLGKTAGSGHQRRFCRHEGVSVAAILPLHDETATCASGSTHGFQGQSLEQGRRFHDVTIPHGGASSEALQAPLSRSCRRVASGPKIVPALGNTTDR